MELSNVSSKEQSARPWSSKSRCHKKKHNLEAGVRGILASCSSPDAAHQGSREMLNILRQTLEKYQQEESTDPINTKASVSDLMGAELLRLDNKRFVPIKGFARGVNFICFGRENDIPSEIVELIFQHASEDIGCRWTSRVIPIDFSCKPFPPQFEKAIAPVIARSFPTDESVDLLNTSTWACIYNSRHTTTLPRKDVYDIVGKMVDSRYKVNLTNPDITVIVEVNPAFCGFSVVRHFQKYFKYNLFRMCHPEEEDRVQKQSELDRHKNQIQSESELTVE